MSAKGAVEGVAKFYFISLLISLWIGFVLGYGIDKDSINKGNKHGHSQNQAAEACPEGSDGSLRHQRD